MTSPVWATGKTVTAAVRRVWASGAILSALNSPALEAEKETFPLRIKLVGPSRSELGDNFTQVTLWARALQTAAEWDGWQLITRRTMVPGLGPQEVPVAALVAGPEVALGLLGAAERQDAVTFTRALHHLGRFPAVADQLRAVALAKPLDVVAAGQGWPLLVAAAQWVAHHPRPDVYVRAIPIAGMHTKLVETNRALFSRTLTAVLPDAVQLGAARFEERFGLRAPERRVRIRGSRSLIGLPSAPGFGDVTWDVKDLAAILPGRGCPVGLDDVIVVENLTSFLVVPERSGRLVIWGAGYGVDELLGRLPWVRDIKVRYWGDIDTHGYAILARARQVAPHIRSVLMDLEMLNEYRAFCVQEPKQATADLPLLTDDEARVYEGLRNGAWGPLLRLEQERIAFDRVVAALDEIRFSTEKFTAPGRRPDTR